MHNSSGQTFSGKIITVRAKWAGTIQNPFQEAIADVFMQFQ